MSAQEHWQMDASAPELCERYLVPAITSVWANDLLDRISPRPGENSRRFFPSSSSLCVISFSSTNSALRSGSHSSRETIFGGERVPAAIAKTSLIVGSKT